VLCIITNRLLHTAAAPLQKNSNSKYQGKLTLHCTNRLLRTLHGAIDRLNGGPY